MKLNEKKINEFFKIINEKKIKSVFQPIVSLKTGEIVSFEALSLSLIHIWYNRFSINSRKVFF